MALQKGSSGNDVKALQTALNVLKIVSPALVVDGVFGIRTDEAVRAFQTRAKIPSDGIVGATTQNAIRGAVANPAAWAASGTTIASKLPVQPVAPKMDMPVKVDPAKDTLPPAAEAEAGFPVLPALAVAGIAAFLWMRSKK